MTRRDFCLHDLLLPLICVLGLGYSETVLAAPFTVTDGSFSGGVYNFQFIPGTSPSPFLTSSDWFADTDPTVDYFQAGAGSVAGTVGWDFNGQSSALSTLDVGVAMVLADFGTFAINAFEDAYLL